MKLNRFTNLVAISAGLAAFPAATFSAINTVPGQAVARPAYQGTDLFSFPQAADLPPADPAYQPLIVATNECISADLDRADSFSFQPTISSADSSVGSGSCGGGISAPISIPEPSTYAIMAGLGALGLVAWRKGSPARARAA
jgi:hypothetical protein